MALYKRGNVWWMNFWEGNYHVQRTTKCTNKRDAETVERAFRTQIAKGEVGIEAKKAVPRFIEAMQDFISWSKIEHSATESTHKRYVTSSKALLRFFADVPLDQITKDEVENFKKWRIRQKKQPPRQKLKSTNKTTASTIKPATVNRELACLKIMLNQLIQNDMLIANPVSKVKFLKEDNEQMRVLSEEEERLYLMAASQPLQDIAILMLETGMRPEEVCRIEIRNVNLERGFLYNPHGKTKAAKRRIGLSQRAHDVLQRRISSAKGKYVFQGGRNGTDLSKPIIKPNAAHNGAIKRSEIAACRLYDLRHTFATRATESGVDLVTLAAMLGHSRIQMVLRYAHPTEIHQFDAIRKMENHRATKRAS